jgi:mannose-6-phosphate isomerase class I
MLRHQQTIETTPKFSNHHGRTISPSMNQQCFGDGQEMSVSKLDVFFSVYVFLPKILRSLNLLLHISLHPSKKKAESSFRFLANGQHVSNFGS